MEHSALHAFEMIGQVIALGGVFFILALLRPAQSALGRAAPGAELAAALSASATTWVCRGALLAALATMLNFFVQVAEVQGKTVFNGVNLALVGRFAMETHVGRLSLARIAVLILMAGAIRLRVGYKWWLAGALGLGAVTLNSLVSHAAAQPVGRGSLIAAQLAHTTAAAIWIGVLIHLLAARPWIQGPEGAGGIALLSEIVRRFSPVALFVTSLLGLSGLFMLFRFLGDPVGVVTSAYGLTLIVKLSMLAPALYAGSVNFRRIRPRLLALAATQSTSASVKISERQLALVAAEPDDDSPSPLRGERAGVRGEGVADAPRSVEATVTTKASSILRWFGRMLELEVTAGVLVLIMAGILASVSPPGEAGAYRLTANQVEAMLSPRFPTADVVNPATFYGADMRGLDDLHYSEFTHHWSGVMVCLLGLGWLAQGATGRLSKWAAYVWPFLLVPFAAFVAVASDPEVWLLHKVSWWHALGDPQLLEHQLGAVIILVLVWLGWRDNNQPAANRPLGYALPVIFILGGILLLGHAHSTLTITDDVTNLINVQHAIFGTFMIFAGVTRWLSLRELLPRRVGNLIWPCMIIGLGVFMTFFYREAV